MYTGEKSDSGSDNIQTSTHIWTITLFWYEHVNVCACVCLYEIHTWEWERARLIIYTKLTYTCVHTHQNTNVSAMAHWELRWLLLVWENVVYCQSNRANANWLYILRKLFAAKQIKNKEPNWNKKKHTHNDDNNSNGINCRVSKGTSKHANEWVSEWASERDSMYDDILASAHMQSNTTFNIKINYIYTNL